MTKRFLRLPNHSALWLVGILVIDLLDVVQRGEEDVEELWVEVFPPMFGHEIDGVIEGEGGLVDPLCGEGIKGIGDRGDPSFQGNRFALQLARISVAIPPLMVGPGDRCRDFEDLRIRSAEDTIADLRMLRDDFEFFRRELAGLEEYMIRRADFPDVVHRTGGADQITPFGGQPILPGEQFTVMTHALNVLRRSTVPVFGGDGESLNRFFS